MTNSAIICHKTADRLRIKIPSRRGDEGFFSELQSEFGEKYKQVDINSTTGSILVKSDRIDPDEIAAFASEKGLFELSRKKRNAEPVSKNLSDRINNLNAGIRKFSDGDFDLPGIFFILLLSFGVFELIRGNFRTPPWYTAFWYAFGVFSKSLVDRR